MTDDEHGEAGERFDEIELEGDLDPHEAEMLRLELHRLARRHGIELGEVRIRPAAGDGSG